MLASAGSMCETLIRDKWTRITSPREGPSRAGISSVFAASQPPRYRDCYVKCYSDEAKPIPPVPSSRPTSGPSWGARRSPAACARRTDARPLRRLRVWEAHIECLLMRLSRQGPECPRPTG